MRAASARSAEAYRPPTDAQVETLFFSVSSAVRRSASCAADMAQASWEPSSPTYSPKLSDRVWSSRNRPHRIHLPLQCHPVPPCLLGAIKGHVSSFNHRRRAGEGTPGRGRHPTEMVAGTTPRPAYCTCPCSICRRMRSASSSAAASSVSRSKTTNSNT